MVLMADQPPPQPAAAHDLRSSATGVGRATGRLGRATPGLGFAASGLGRAAPRLGWSAARLGTPPAWGSAATRVEPRAHAVAGGIRALPVDGGRGVARRHLHALPAQLRPDRLDQRGGADPLRAAHAGCSSRSPASRAFVRSPFASFGTQTITPAQEQQLLNTYLGVLAVSRRAALGQPSGRGAPLGEAATTRAVSDRYLDRPSSLLAAYRARMEPARCADHDDPAS